MSTRNLIHFVNEEYLSSLYNIERKEFLSRYLPEGITLEECIRENILHAPFSVRDKASRYLAIGIVGEIKAGRATPSGGIYIDLRDCPSFRDTPGFALASTNPGADRWEGVGFPDNFVGFFVLFTVGLITTY